MWSYHSHTSDVSGPENLTMKICLRGFEVECLESESIEERLCWSFQSEFTVFHNDGRCIIFTGLLWDICSWEEVFFLNPTTHTMFVYSSEGLL